MQEATFEKFTGAYDALKLQFRCTISNFFMDSYQLREVLEQKSCYYHTTSGAVFLLIPLHGIYYDCLFLANNEEIFAESLAKMLASYQEMFPIRCSVFGKEPKAGELSKILIKNNFHLTKKLLRMRLAKPEEKILKAMRPYAEEFKNQLSFAKEEDAEEIMEILQNEFNIVADNLPEMGAIRKHIARQEVAVLRQDEKIAALHYFSIKNNTLHALYDVTRKEYRGGNGFFMALAVFVYDYLRAQGKRCPRALGWRDAANHKLVKHAKKSNQMPDDVVIYNMLWTPTGAGRNAQDLPQ